MQSLAVVKNQLKESWEEDFDAMFNKIGDDLKPKLLDVDRAVKKALITDVAPLNPKVLTPDPSPFGINVHKLLGVEGEYSNDSADSGSETMWGITIAVARENGYHGPMNELTVQRAAMIYRSEYWDKCDGDTIYTRMPFLASRVFDLAVNGGVSRAGQYLQRCLNVQNYGGRYYPDVEVDGKIGPATMECLVKYKEKRGETGMIVLVAQFMGLQSAHYTTLAERRPKDEAFVYGWNYRRIVEPAIEFAKLKLVHDQHQQAA